MTRVLIVTGGSGGIGAATARRAAGEGYSVVVNYNAGRNPAEAVVADIEQDGGRAIAVQADISTESEATRLFDVAEAAFGPVTALFNNAGITGPISRLAELDVASLRRVFEINVIGSFLAAREAVRRMSLARGGSGGAIVNMSSRAAQLGGGGEWLHYAASKGAIDSFTIGLAREIAEDGIRVNAVAPGLIATEIHARAGDADRVERLLPGVPMKRVGMPDEVADVVLWLLGTKSSYVNGVIVPISGGR